MDYSGKRLYNIPHFNRYYITTDGEVIDKRFMKTLSYSSYLKKSGFSYLLLDKNDTRIRITINELLMLTFYGYTGLNIKEKIHIGKDEYEFINVRNLEYDDTEFLKYDNNRSDKITINNMEYRKIPDTNDNGYINTDGAVYNFYTHKFAKKTYGKENEYPRITIFTGSKEEYSKDVHRILGIVFLPDYRPDLIVNHKDAYKYNSYLSNLEMVTSQENIIHAANMGLIKHAYNSNEIERLCKLLEDNTPLKDIPSKMGWKNDKASHETISRMIYRICVKGQWEDISSKYDLSKYQKVVNNHAIYSNEDIHEVCRLIQDTDYSNKIISKLTNIPKDTVQNIRAGKQWTDISKDYNLNYIQMQKRLTDDERRTLLHYMEDPNMSNKDIAKIMNMSNSSIVAIRNGTNTAFDYIKDEYNIIRPKEFSTDLTESEVIKICKMILDGKSNQTIANTIRPESVRFSETIRSIRKGNSYTGIASKYGIPCEKFLNSPNDRNYVTKEQYEEIEKLIKETDKGNTEIGAMVGVPWYLVRTRRAHLKDTGTI